MRSKKCNPGELNVAKSVSQILEDLERRFPDGPTADEVVRSQGFDFLAHHWTDRWPQNLAVPELLQGNNRNRITRSDVFLKARTVASELKARTVASEGSILELYVAVCAWGTGTKAQRVARCIKPLYQEGAVAALARSFKAAQSLEPAEAYRRLNTWGEDRIKYFGPAFFTKWLYFSAFDAWDRGQIPAPLILDARVARAIGWKTEGWPSSAYRDYLVCVAEIRSAWCPREPSHVVEYALFKLGGS